MILLVFLAWLKKPKKGFEVNVWKPKVINQLKEDKQAFGLLVAR